MNIFNYCVPRTLCDLKNPTYRFLLCPATPVPYVAWWGGGGDVKYAKYAHILPFSGTKKLTPCVWSDVPKFV